MILYNTEWHQESRYAGGKVTRVHPSFTPVPTGIPRTFPYSYVDE